MFLITTYISLSFITQFIIVYQFIIVLFCLKKTINSLKTIKKNEKYNDDFIKQFWSGINLLDLYKKIQNNKKNKSSIPKIFEAGITEFSKNNRTEQAIMSSKRSMEIIEIREMNNFINKSNIIYSVSNSIYYVGLIGILLKYIEVTLYLSNLKDLDNHLIVMNTIESTIIIIFTLLSTLTCEFFYRYLVNRIKKYELEIIIFIKELLNILQKQISK